jgi:hypothetical protein
MRAKSADRGLDMNKNAIKKGKMTRRGYQSPVAAYRTLLAYGYHSYWTKPGWPTKWAQPGGKNPKAVGKHTSISGIETWDIVEYPNEPMHTPDMHPASVEGSGE